MKKITLALAGLAIAATASMVPASANGVFYTASGPTTFSFTSSPTGFSLFTPAKFTNFSTGTTVTGSLFLAATGAETGTSYVFDSTNLLFSAPGITDFEVGKGTLTFSGSKIAFTSFGPSFSGATSSGDYVDLTTSAPVPESSTVISFGALLALGGLAVLRRKSVKNAA